MKVRVVTNGGFLEEVQQVRDEMRERGIRTAEMALSNISGVLPEQVR